MQAVFVRGQEGSQLGPGLPLRWRQRGVSTGTHNGATVQVSLEVAQILIALSVA
jgi:hypothetical protein